MFLNLLLLNLKRKVPLELLASAPRGEPKREFEFLLVEEERKGKGELKLKGEKIFHLEPRKKEEDKEPKEVLALNWPKNFRSNVHSREGKGDKKVEFQVRKESVSLLSINRFPKTETLRASQLKVSEKGKSYRTKEVRREKETAVWVGRAPYLEEQFLHSEVHLNSASLQLETPVDGKENLKGTLIYPLTRGKTLAKLHKRIDSLNQKSSDIKRLSEKRSLEVTPVRPRASLLSHIPKVGERGKGDSSKRIKLVKLERKENRGVEVKVNRFTAFKPGKTSPSWEDLGYKKTEETAAETVSFRETSKKTANAPYLLSRTSPRVPSEGKEGKKRATSVVKGKRGKPYELKLPNRKRLSNRAERSNRAKEVSASGSKEEKFFHVRGESHFKSFEAEPFGGEKEKAVIKEISKEKSSLEPVKELGSSTREQNLSFQTSTNQQEQSWKPFSYGEERGNSPRDVFTPRDIQSFTYRSELVNLKASLTREQVINLTLEVSGSFVDRELLSEIKEIIRSAGLIPGRVYLKPKSKAGSEDNRERTELRV